MKEKFTRKYFWGREGRAKFGYKSLNNLFFLKEFTWIFIFPKLKIQKIFRYAINFIIFPKSITATVQRFLDVADFDWVLFKDWVRVLLLVLETGDGRRKCEWHTVDVGSEGLNKHDGKIKFKIEKYPYSVSNNFSLNNRVNNVKERSPKF